MTFAQIIFIGLVVAVAIAPSLFVGLLVYRALKASWVKPSEVNQEDTIEFQTDEQR